MDEQITERVLTVANSILQKKTTIRNIALLYGVSKSTVHKDLTERLIDIDLSLYERVRELLEYNKSVRHIRGGNSTKLKYLNHIK
ncbi:MAG: sporulation transcriptional regulator SpoIIID [Haloplasmataceae bacterium]|jgi:putative DeoR family transcriptional regulator (stage III sporulation protein D)|nr:sporulation transcriptional regulator SpoIIID [Haloplasmataceae bacterium]